MSKVLDSIEAKLTGHGSYEKELYNADISVNVTRDTVRILDEYLVKYSFGAYYSCEPGEKDQAMHSIKELFRDVLYGEFRDKLIKLERAIYNQKRDNQLALIKELLFEVSGR
jgi:hypothetical protein